MTASNETQDRLRLTMAAIWERNLPTVRERLDLLDSAAEAVAAATLSSEQRIEAAATAHKLAGSLGMFGYAESTDMARRLEQSFTSTNELDAVEIRELTAELRSTLGL